MQNPNIDDEMTANGYVQCGGCGGYLPAGAICGYCLQRQQGVTPAMAAPAAAVRPKRTKPFKAIASLTLCAIAVCAIGAGAVIAARAVSKGSASTMRSGPASNNGSASLTSGANQEVINALSSGDTQQALSAMAAASSPPPPSTLAAPAAETPQTPVMQQGSTPPPAATLAVEKAGMPDDVRNWLEHLNRIEQTRVGLAASQIQNAMRTLATLQSGDLAWAMDGDEEDSNADATRKKQQERAQRVGNDMQSLQTAWRTLSTAFNSVPPPAECVGIKANYDQVINQTGNMMVDIIGQLQNASKDPQAAISALTAMQGQSKSRIDVPARAADQGVGSICRKYDVTKWFDIQGDVGSGAMAQVGF